jgi:hypothetical protein
MSTFSTGKAAAYLVKTLQRWDREGRLKPERTPSGRRAYSKAMLDSFMRRDPPQGARLGLAKPRINARGHGASSVCASIPASTMEEPRTETVRACAHI